MARSGHFGFGLRRGRNGLFVRPPPIFLDQRPTKPILLIDASTELSGMPGLACQFNIGT